MEIILGIATLIGGLWLWWKIFQYILIPIFRPVFAFLIRVFAFLFSGARWLVVTAISIGLVLWTLSDFVLLFSIAPPLAVLLLLFGGSFFLIRRAKNRGE